MILKITEADVKAYIEFMGDDNPIHRTRPIIIPGNLIVHSIIKALDLKKYKKNQYTFNKPTYIGELIKLDYHQMDDVIEYKVTSGRILKVTGTLQI